VPRKVKQTITTEKGGWWTISSQSIFLLDVIIDGWFK
jgi:hypothetical protein